MMTFILVCCLVENAKLLDDLRLGKQRVEATQILNILTGSTSKKGWINHPIVKAWEGYVEGLKYYTNCCIQEWINRGKNNNIPLYDIDEDKLILPWWTQWDRLHQSHRAMLLRKNPFYYNDKFEVDDEYNNYGYIWPHLIDTSNVDAPLSEISAPIPPELINPQYCSAIIKSGKNKGSTCFRLIKKSNQSYCSIHNK
jgi:hypothetical protein